MSKKPAVPDAETMVMTALAMKLKDLAARVAELERIGGIDPADSEPENRPTLQMLAEWVMQLSRKVAELRDEVRDLRDRRGELAELRNLRERFEAYVSDHDPTKRSP